MINLKTGTSLWCPLSAYPEKVPPLVDLSTIPGLHLPSCFGRKYMGHNFVIPAFCVSIHIWMRSKPDNADIGLLLIRLRSEMTNVRKRWLLSFLLIWTLFPASWWISYQAFWFQYYANPTTHPQRLMPMSNVIREQRSFVIDQIISSHAHSPLPWINYFHPQQWSILTHTVGMRPAKSNP